ncbi:MAG TPA: SusC/RagA family TonB-linked outer membrane protein [Cyclobacteriaceae bacterium]
MKKCQTHWGLILFIMRITGIQIFLMLVLSGAVVASTTDTFGQDVLDKLTSIKAEGETMRSVLKKIEKSANIKFTYNTQTIPVDQEVSFEFHNEKLSNVLNGIFNPMNVQYQLSGSYIILRKNQKHASVDDDAPSLDESLYAFNIKGKVVDEQGSPLPGVNVVVKGTTTGTTTDAEGVYSLKLNDGNETLIFSFIGYATLEMPVGGNTVLDVTLKSDIVSLGEVVVVGYGTQTKSDLTSSVASVKSENFIKGNVMDAGQLIQGKVAGLTVSVPSGDPTSGSQILLRGSSTLLGTNTNPLILVDGVPGDLRTVAPEDIESIDILKDGSAAAIYGTRGTNGVIIITTKRAKADEGRVEYSSSFSTQQITRKLNMLTAADYRRQIADGTRLATDDKGASTDWLKQITRTPFSQIHNLTFKGGNSKTNYLASFNYRGLEGIFLKSDNRTLTGRVDINHSMFNDKLTFNFGFINQTNRYNTSGDGTSFNGYTYRQALIRNPTEPVKNAQGNWYENTGAFNYENPVSRIKESDGENRSQNSRLNTTIVYKPFEGMRLSALFSSNRFNQARGYAETKKHISNLRDGKNGYVSNGARETEDRLMELTAQYTRSIGDHNATLLAGYGYQSNYYRDFWMTNYDFPTDAFSYHQIQLGNALAEGKAQMNGFTSKTNLISFFGRATYNFRDKYLLMASLRHEAASQLYGANHPWGTFPAISAGWKISNEPFLKSISMIDNLKIRAGYGVTGTPNSNGFGAVSLLGYGDPFYYEGNWIRTLVPSQNPNPYLKWEEKHETNVGLDYSLFNGRVSGTVDYYIRRIKNLLYDYPVPSPPNLYTSTRANVGVMENKGVEVMLNIVPVQTKDLQWTTSFMYSTNTNKLVTLSNDLYKTTNDYFTVGGTGEPIQTFTHLVKVGEKIGNFYGFKVVDITEDGKWIYEDNKGEHVEAASFSKSFDNKKVLGNGLPKAYVNWNNTVQYKNFDLSVTMRGAFGFQILNFERMYLENPTITNYNRLKSSEDKVFGKAKLNSELEFNSYYIENGNFWKIDNITLGYNFKNLNTKFMRSARVYVSTLNTFIFTHYKGIDPEVNRLGLDPGNDGRDKYPTARTYTIGFNLAF